jgi:hypothetical protein
MFSSAKELIIAYVKRQTALGVRRDIGIVPEPTPIVDELSDKAKKVQEIIDSGKFGCQTEAVADLVSALMGEKIAYKKSDDDDDDLFEHGEEMSVPEFSLLYCLHNDEDDQSNDVCERDLILNLGRSEEDWNVPPSDLMEQKDREYLNAKGELEYNFSVVYENVFRFATEKEIDNFFENIPDATLPCWFKQVFWAFTLLTKDS